MSVSLKPNQGAPPEPTINDQKVAHLTRILRIVGAGVLLAAAGTFLVQRWGSANDVQRYLGLLAFTATLPLIAFICGLGLREGKGARVLLGSMLTMVPVHFGVVGGLLYSQFNWDGVPASVPSYARWVAGSPLSALLCAALALAALYPMTRLALRALARSKATLLTHVYFAANALLFVPSRHANVAALLIGLFTVGWAWLELKVLRKDVTMRTLEGRWVRALLPLPALMILGRQLEFYATTSLFSAVAWGSLAALLVASAHTATDKAKTRNGQLGSRWLRRLAIFPAAIAWGFVTQSIERSFGVNDAGALMIYALPMTALLVVAGIRYLTCSRYFFGWAALLATGFTLLGASIWPSPAMSVLTIGLMVCQLGYAYLARRRWLIALAAVGLALSVTRHLLAAIAVYHFAGWASLAAVGVLIIVGTSMLEKWAPKLAAISKRVALSRERFDRRFGEAS